MFFGSHLSSLAAVFKYYVQGEWAGLKVPHPYCTDSGSKNTTGTFYKPGPGGFISQHQEKVVY